MVVKAMPRTDYPKHRQFVTEYINIDSLADHHIWSLITILPTIFPEPTSMESGPRTAVTEAFYYKLVYSLSGQHKKRLYNLISKHFSASSRAI